MKRGVIKLGVTKEELLSITEVNTLHLDLLSVDTWTHTLLFYACHTAKRTHIMYTIHTNAQNGGQGSPLQIPFLLSTFRSLVSTGKDTGFVRAGKEHYKCWVFYYLALKAQHTATIIISTAVLFYKIVKDDETALPESEIKPCLVMEGKCEMFHFSCLSCKTWTWRSLSAHFASLSPSLRFSLPLSPTFFLEFFFLLASWQEMGLGSKIEE